MQTVLAQDYWTTLGERKDNYAQAKDMLTIIIMIIERNNNTKQKWQIHPMTYVLYLFFEDFEAQKSCLGDATPLYENQALINMVVQFAASHKVDDESLEALFPTRPANPLHETVKCPSDCHFEGLPDERVSRLYWKYITWRNLFMPKLRKFCVAIQQTNNLHFRY